MQLTTEEFVIDAASPWLATKEEDGAVIRTPEELAELVERFAASEAWVDRVRLSTGQRWYERLHHGAGYDIWVISWMPGQSTGFHDHGESAGAFVVATGVLEEHRVGELPVEITPGVARFFSDDYAHDVRNVSQGPAVSIHAYSPPLSEMNEYQLEGTDLVPVARPSERAASLEEETTPAEELVFVNRAGAPGIEETLARARVRLERLTPEEARKAVDEQFAVLVDIRPEAQRAREGSIPGAVVVERNVLEWRFDPTSSARLPIAKNHDLRVIVFCSEGYTSSLAAASLQDLGLHYATDIAGGYQAWRAAGLPVFPPR